MAVHAIQRARYSVAGRAVDVSGAGPVGLALAHLTHLMGAACVVVIEPNPYRRAQAERLGVIALHPDEHVVGRCRDLTRRRGGFDVAFECSGAPGTLTALFEAVRREATVVTVGHPGHPGRGQHRRPHQPEGHHPARHLRPRQGPQAPVGVLGSVGP